MNTTQPLVSVVIICYRQEDLIEATIRSAADQDHENLEVIVADDASPDRTQEIIRRLADEYPGRVLPQLGDTNRGVTGNSNRGLHAARGKYIAFLGGDDLFLPGKISACVAWLEADERRVLCGHDMEHFDHVSGRTLWLQSQTSDMRGGTGVERFLLGGVLYPLSAAMFRASALPSYGFDERLPYVSDWKLLLDTTVRGGEWGFVPGVYTRYRHHPKNVTNSFRRECFRDDLVTLALMEADHPHLADLCRQRRAQLYYRNGHAASTQPERIAEARELLRLAFLTAPERSLKAGAAYALSYLPTPARERVLAARTRLAHYRHTRRHAR